MIKYLDVDDDSVWESLADEMANELLVHYKKSQIRKKSAARENNGGYEMGLKKVTLSEAKDLTLGFEITEEMLENSLPQLIEILRKKGFPEEVLSSWNTKDSDKPKI